MNYSETLSYLYSQLPMYHRIGAAAYKADLKNTQILCEMLSHPEKKFKSIHIAGTNGKGSTSHMLAAILQSAGYKTGLYTSPHLKDFRERIRINGKMIAESVVVDFVHKHKAAFDEMELSFFEWTVGLCFDYFAREEVDIAVIETGLGGRLDSTNVIIPEVSLITNISLDHTNLLGKTLLEIAREKAGIIKKQIPVIIGEDNDATRAIFVDRAEQMQSMIFFPSVDTKVELVSGNPTGLVMDVYFSQGLVLKNLELGLAGNYQQKNIAGVLQAVLLLQQQGWNISREHIYEGLTNVRQLTGLMGRWQQISANPITICDVAHNEAGIREVVTQLRNIPYNKLHFVLGMVSDKDISSVLALLPGNSFYYFCRASIPRALEADELRQRAIEFGLTGHIYPSVRAALKAAQDAAQNGDLVFVGGSTFVVAEVV